MATPIKNNLPPGSQQWVRDIEQRMIALERTNALLQATANQNAATLGALQEAVRSARGGSQSVDLARIVGGTGVESVEARIEVPAWAKSVAFIAPLSIYNLGATGSITASMGIYVLSSGPDREIGSVPSIAATNRASSPAPDANNAITTARTASILPGDTHIVLSGTVNWTSVDEPLGIKQGAASWGLTVFWSASEFTEGSI